MNERQELLAGYVAAARQDMLDALDFLWKHPETGFTEWESHRYLKEAWEKLGYEVQEAGNIPGFYADIDTGRPGPTLCIMAELDALDIANHPCSVNGKNHSCGHHAQGAALLGVAAGLKGEHALDGLSGRIRLMMVPAEEAIQIPFREELRKKGIIRYYGGKQEFIYRGLLDDVDLAIMVHTGNSLEKDFSCRASSNGFLIKSATFQGHSVHAAGASKGINAEYAAVLALEACNALRETFRDEDHVRFHPILKGVDTAVNIIPNEMVMETYIRSADAKSMYATNKRINRALAGSAVSIGARLLINDRPGYMPDTRYKPMMELVEKCCCDLVGAEKVWFKYDGHGSSSSDFGDVTSLMPGVQYHAAGATGTSHGTDYYVSNPDKACVNSAKSQVLVANELLKDEAKAAREIIASYRPTFASKQEYVDFLDSMTMDRDAVAYEEDGRITVCV